MNRRGFLGCVGGLLGSLALGVRAAVPDPDDMKKVIDTDPLLSHPLFNKQFNSFQEADEFLFKTKWKGWHRHPQQHFVLVNYDKRLHTHIYSHFNEVDDGCYQWKHYYKPFREGKYPIMGKF